MEWEKATRQYLPNTKTAEIFKIFETFNRKSKITILAGGHIHNDFVTFNYAGGIPIFLTDSDSMYKSCNRLYRPIENTPSEQCLNCIICDFQEKISYIVRIGRGKDSILKIDDKILI